MQTFHSVCRVADVLIALQQHGNSNYLGWSLSLPCDLKNVVSKLNSQASVMEGHLEEWKKQVSEQRDEYYELNYFSTQQLLSLREELGKFKLASEAEADVSPKIMAMLRSISPEMTKKSVKEQVSIVDVNIKKHKQVLEMGSASQDTLSRTHVKSRTQMKESMPFVVDEWNPDASAPSAVDEHPGLNKQRTSNQSVVVDENLAAASYNACPTTVPQPKLSIEQLTKNQHSILINVEENCGMSKKLVLLAFEHCERPYVENEIIDWCIEHQNAFQYEDSDTSSQSSASAGESDSEAEGEAEKHIKFLKY